MHGQHGWSWTASVRKKAYTTVVRFELRLHVLLTGCMRGLSNMQSAGCACELHLLHMGIGCVMPYSSEICSYIHLFRNHTFFGLAFCPHGLPFTPGLASLANPKNRNRRQSILNPRATL